MTINAQLSDLGADEADMPTITSALEEELGVAVPPEDAYKFDRVGQIVDYLMQPRYRATR